VQNWQLLWSSSPESLERARELVTGRRGRTQRFGPVLTSVTWTPTQVRGEGYLTPSPRTTLSVTARTNGSSGLARSPSCPSTTRAAPGQGQPVYGRVSAAYTIEVSDCRKMSEALKLRGVKFETEVLEYPWGYVAVFQDPDGNWLQLRQGR
jgi:hypothetical protein